MKPANPNQEITREEIERALKEYFEKGGKIKNLPQEKALSIQVIEENKWGAYESLRDLLYF